MALIPLIGIISLTVPNSFYTVSDYSCGMKSKGGRP